MLCHCLLYTCITKQQDFMHSPASGNDFSLNDNQKQLIVRFQNGLPLCKMAPHCALGRIPRITGTRKWLPYGGSSLDAEVFRPLEPIEPVFSAFQWAFSFCLMRISLNSNLNGTNYPRQVRHHCTRKTSSRKHMQVYTIASFGREDTANFSPLLFPRQC